MLAERDIRNGNTLRVIGNTVRRNLFLGTSPIGKELRVNNISSRAIGVLSRQGANMMGTDQDNIVLALWSAVKFRVRGITLASTNHSSSASGSSFAASRSANTLNDL